jgi:hypothetical protein
MNKTLLDKVLIPLIQSGILSFVAGVSGFSVASLLEQSNAILWGIALGFSFCSFWLIKSFDGSSYWRPQNKGIRARKLEAINKEVHKITAIAADRQSGSFHKLTTPMAIMTRVCFHLVYLDGKLSYDYLVDKQKILSRGDMKKLREEMISESLLEQGIKRNSPCEITTAGNSVILQYAKLYKPNKEERKYLSDKLLAKRRSQVVNNEILQPICNEQTLDRIHVGV